MVVVEQGSTVSFLFDRFTLYSSFNVLENIY